MRPVARLLAVVLLASAPAALALASCGTDAQNIQACRDVEGARCEAAAACTAGFDVAGCKRFYRDACLVGTANADGDAGTPDAVTACIAAIQACAAADGGSADGGCPGQALKAGALCQVMNSNAGGSAPFLTTIEPTACNIILHCPQVLSACAWVGDVNAPVSTDGGSDGGDAGDGSTGTGGGGGTGGTGGSG